VTDIQILSGNCTKLTQKLFTILQKEQRTVTCTEASRKAPLAPNDTHSLLRLESHTAMHFEIKVADG